MTASGETRRMEKLVLASLNEAQREAMGRIVGYYEECQYYQPLLPDDTFWTERDRVAGPALVLHNNDPALHPKGGIGKMCHYGSGFHDGWHARVTWERRNEVLPSGFQRGFEAARKMVKALVQDAHNRLGHQLWPQRKWGLERLAHYQEVLDALEEER